MTHRFLIAYPYLAANGDARAVLVALARAGRVEVLIDSGAYTAHRQGIRIDLRRYISLCAWAAERLGPALWGCIALDRIDDARQSRRNLAAMVAAGIRPMPVITADDDLASTPDLAALSPRLAVAGGVINTPRWTVGRCQDIYRRAGRPVELHALGFVRYPFMYDERIASVDSTSWNNGQRWGVLQFFDGRRMRNVRADKPVPAFARPFLVTHGYRTRAAFNSREATRGGASFGALACIYSHVRQGAYAATRGLRIFNAITSTDAMVAFLAVARNGRLDRALLDIDGVRRDLAAIRARRGPERRAAIVALAEAA